MIIAHMAEEDDCLDSVIAFGKVVHHVFQSPRAVPFPGRSSDFKVGVLEVILGISGAVGSVLGLVGLVL